MMEITATPHPAGSLLARYDATEGSYTDCFRTSVRGEISLEDLIRTFFDTPLFRLEKRLLTLAGAKYDTPDDLDAFATGTGSHWLEWHTQERDNAQILLFVGKTSVRSWLMVIPESGGTQICFGSALLPSPAKQTPGLAVRLTTPLHRGYARALLWSTARKFKRT